MINLIWLLLSFGQLQRISFLKGQINLFIYEIVMTLLFICYFSKFKFNPLIRFKKNNYLKVFGLFLIILPLSLINNFFTYGLYENLIGFAYLLRIYLYCLFFIYFHHFLLKTKKAGKSYFTGILIFSILTVLFSFGQYFLYPNLRNLYYAGWDPHWYRVFGTFFDSSIGGMIYVILFYFYLYKLKFTKNPKLKTIFYSFTFLLLILILLTYSRIVYLSFIPTIIYYFYTQKKLKYISISLIIFAILIILLPRPFGESVRLERVFSIYSRTTDINQGLTIFKKNPILGIGYNRIKTYKNNNHSQSDIISHSSAAYSSSYITILVTTGIVGFSLFIILIYLSWIRLNIYSRTLLVPVIIASLFENIILVNYVFFVLIGLVLFIEIEVKKISLVHK